MIASAVIFFPLYWMVVIAFSPRGEVFRPGGVQFWPSTFSTENFASLFARFPIADWFVNSLVIGAFVTALTVIVNLLAGTRSRGSGSRVAASCSSWLSRR